MTDPRGPRVLPDPDVVHVYPTNDLIDHETCGGGCVCGPEVRPVPRSDGSMGWLFVRHSLDGRELNE